MGHAWHAAPGLAGATLAWTAMMGLMMAPTVAPWIGAFHRFGAAARAGAGRWGATALFAAGYLCVWLLFGAALALLQHWLPPLHAYTGLLLAGAGLFQLSPLKQACLSHCRNPLSFLLTRWREGPRPAFVLGLSHGVYCLGCCWALMLTMVAVGTASLAWMAALTVLTFVEQVAPFGARLRVPIGIALLAAGLFLR